MAPVTSQPLLPNNLPLIPIKLDGSNYYLWKSIMMSLLESYDLLEYAEGTKIAPPLVITTKHEADITESPNPDFQQWPTYDQFCLTCIYVVVTPEVGL